jgi:hypothetical protein
VGRAKALKIKALDGMPRKKAVFKTLINQTLTFAMAFVAKTDLP